MGIGRQSSCVCVPCPSRLQPRRSALYPEYWRTMKAATRPGAVRSCSVLLPHRYHPLRCSWSGAALFCASGTRPMQSCGGCQDHEHMHAVGTRTHNSLYPLSFLTRRIYVVVCHGLPELLPPEDVRAYGPRASPDARFLGMRSARDGHRRLAAVAAVDVVRLPMPALCSVGWCGYADYAVRRRVVCDAWARGIPVQYIRRIHPGSAKGKACSMVGYAKVSGTSYPV